MIHVHRFDTHTNTRVQLSLILEYIPGRITNTLDRLIALRREDGGWSLASFGTFERLDGSEQARDSDGYATGFALHALLRAGIAADRPDAAAGLAWLRSHQQADGSWPGHSLNKKRDPKTFIGHLMTDAATAIAVQALVEAEKP